MSAKRTKQERAEIEARTAVVRENAAKLAQRRTAKAALPPQQLNDKLWVIEGQLSQILADLRLALAPASPAFADPTSAPAKANANMSAAAKRRWANYRTAKVPPSGDML